MKDNVTTLHPTAAEKDRDAFEEDLGRDIEVLHDDTLEGYIIVALTADEDECKWISYRAPQAMSNATVIETLGWVKKAILEDEEMPEVP